METVGALIKCSQCGNRVTIIRNKAKQKKKGHAKHFWCVNCKERIKHLEEKE